MVDWVSVYDGGSPGKNNPPPNPNTVSEVSVPRPITEFRPNI